MFVEMLLASSVLLTPAADRHAEVWAQMAAHGDPAAGVIQLAQSPSTPPPMHPPMAGQPPMAGHPPGPAAHPPEFQHGPPYLRALALSDAQQDKVFAILHAQMPAVRERQRELQRARAELHQLARAERFDEARAAALSDAIGRATAALDLLRVRSDAQIWQVLTPEQRQQAAAMPPHPGPPPFDPRGPRG